MLLFFVVFLKKMTPLNIFHAVIIDNDVFCVTKHVKQRRWRKDFKLASLLSVAPAGYVGNMASSDVHVRICEQEILKYDLEIKALIQVRIFLW